MAHFFLAPGIELGIGLGLELGIGRESRVPPEEVFLTGAEARHAVTVSRVRVGESLVVGDGKGTVVRGSVVAASADRLRLRVESVEYVEAPSPRILLAQALAKGDRDELAIQAATELGVDVVIPWAAERSVSRWQGAKVGRGFQRWEAIVREATKQSIRPWIPGVQQLATTKQLAAMAADRRMLVLEPTATARLTGIEPDPEAGRRDILVVAGPEGGIAVQELDAFVAAGAELVRLGDTVLRTSTAGPAAIAVLNARLGRW